MMEMYRGFTIQKNKVECVYGKENFIIINYLVYKEIDGEKYFLPEVTAFDTVDIAKETIDRLLDKKIVLK